MQYERRNRWRFRIIAAFCLLWVGPISAAITGSVSSDESTIASNIDNLAVPLFKSRVLKLDKPAARVSIGNPDIADILIVRAGQIYVLGKDVGTTNVHLWDTHDELIGTISVEVTHDLESLKYKLHELLPMEPIEVFSVQRSIVLRGNVSSLNSMDNALRMADAYLSQIQTDKEVTQFEQSDGGSKREDKSVGSVINMMSVSGGQQIMLEVKVAEIARSELKRMNAQFNLQKLGSKWNFGGVNGGAIFPFDQFTPNTAIIANQGLFASFLTSNTIFNMVLDAAKENGLAKILAEPTLTTLTGQEANFLSGGEFPIPVPQGDRGVTIQFKEFGVALKFLPVILDGDTINIKLNISVSELVNSNTIGITSPDSTSNFVIPSLTKRSASATVELSEGQTMGIAGLISENLRQSVTKFPGLGDLPVLGALFRSQDFINNESELVIVVTPHIAKPMSPGDIRLPTDKFVEPNDTDFYLMGRFEGKAKKQSTNPDPSGGTDSNFGHQVE